MILQLCVFIFKRYSLLKIYCIIYPEASDDDPNSGAGIHFEEKKFVKRWHCPWGSTVVDDIAPLFRVILEENYLSSSTSPLEDTKKNRSLWWTQRKSLDQRLGKFLG